MIGVISCVGERFYALAKIVLLAEDQDLFSTLELLVKEMYANANDFRKLRLKES